MRLTIRELVRRSGKLPVATPSLPLTPRRTNVPPLALPLNDTPMPAHCLPPSYARRPPEIGRASGPLMLSMNKRLPLLVSALPVPTPRARRKRGIAFTVLELHDPCSKVTPGETLSWAGAGPQWRRSDLVSRGLQAGCGGSCGDSRRLV